MPTFWVYCRDLMYMIASLHIAVAGNKTSECIYCIVFTFYLCYDWGV